VLTPFVRALELLVRFFKLRDFCRQLRISIIMPEQRVSAAWIALRAIPYKGLFPSPVLLILMALCGIMGVVHTPMLFA
jgi:hypothetical protein